MVLELIQNVALLVALAVGLRTLARWKGPPSKRRTALFQLLTGLLFGVVGIAGMMTPMHFAPGVIYDGRSIVLSLAGFFGGPMVVLVAAVMCGAYRVHLGGAGMLAGVLVIAEAATFGTALHYLRRRDEVWASPARLWVFGLLVHVVMLALQLLIPDTGWEALYQIGPAVLILYPLGFLLTAQVFLDGERRIEAEQALRESEERYRAVAEETSVLICRFLPSGEIIYVNEAYGEYFGMTPDELVGTSILSPILEADREAAMANILGITAASPNQSNELRVTGAGGETRWTRWTRWTNRALFDSQGKAVTYQSIGEDITERKRSEEDLRRSEAHLSNALQIARLGHWEYDVRQNLFTFTDEFYSLLRTSAREMGGYTMSLERYAETFVHPDDREAVAVETKKAIETTDPNYSRQQEHKMLYADGTVGHISVRFHIDKDSGGNTTRTYGVNQDITDRKQAEEELLRSERRQREILDNLSSGVVVHAPDTTILSCNQKASELLNLTVDQLLGKIAVDPQWRFLREDGTTMLVDDYPINRTLRDQVGLDNYLVGIVSADTSCVTWALCNSFLAFSETGELDYVLISFLDVTARRHAEEALRVGEGRYRTLFEGSPDAIMTLEPPSWKFTSANPTTVRVFGAEDETHFTSLAPWEVSPETQPDGSPSAEKARAMIETAMREGSNLFEWTHKRFNGEEFPATVLLSRMEWSGEPILQATVRDVTHEVELEAQLRQAHKMEAIGTLAGGIAHDFNNILAAVVGYAEILRDEITEGESPTVANLDEILKAGERARELVGQILAFSRKAESERIPIRISTIAKEALKLLRGVLPSTVEIRQDIRGDSDTVLADPTQIHQVTMNLCTNAWQAMCETGGVLEVRLRPVELDADSAAPYTGLMPGPHLELTIRDTGKGIEQKDLDKIFDPFFTTKPKGEGTGMGLAVVHGVVKGHGGTISVASEVGKGTTFQILLPRLVTDESPAEDEAGELPRGTERILLVDDEEALLKIGTKMLLSLGYRVTTRGDGGSAYEAFAADPDAFDLVFTDLTMPKSTGIELARRMLEARPDMLIILHTGYGDLITSEKAKKIGFQEMLMKPLRKHELALAVRRVLDCRK